MPHRWACWIRALGDIPVLRCFGGRHTKPLSGVNLPVWEAGSPLASEAGVLLEAALQSLLNIHPLHVRAAIYPCLVRDALPSWFQTTQSSAWWRKGFVLLMPFGSGGCKALVLLWLQVVTQETHSPWWKSGREEVRSEQSTLFLLCVLIKYQKGYASLIRR